VKNNVALIGFMGSGKTTIGKILADKLNYSFADSDQVIEEKQGMAISDIFKRFGEGYFRQLEEETIRDLLENNRIVISTGGGSVMNQALFEYMKSNAWVVHLNASIDTLWNRLKNCTNRPMLYHKQPRRRMEELYKKRYPIYQKAHYSIQTDGKTPMDIVSEIILSLESYC